MRHLLKLAVLLSIAFPCFAAGGTCPSGASYINPASANGLPLVTLSSLGITSCYFVAANGADTNTGTDESHPFAFMPGMPNCSANCASLTPSSHSPAAGLGFIFRGGDTWHFGNSGANPYTGGGLNWNNVNNVWGGTAANPIYIGVDQTWFTGGAWARPIFTADNPICNTSTLSGTCTLITQSPTWTLSGLEVQVSSCLYQVAKNTSGGSIANNLVYMGAVKNVIFDNFELTGLCLQTNNGSTGGAMLGYDSLNGPFYIFNVYEHGWSHIQWAAYPPEGGTCTSGEACALLTGYAGSGSTGQGDVLKYDIMDGSDSDPVGAGVGITGFQDVCCSIFRYQTQLIGRGKNHIFHDTLIEYVYDNGHSNVMEFGEQGGTNAYYNSVVRHIGLTGPAPQGIFIAHSLVSSVGAYTTYVFGFTIYDVAGGIFGIGAGDASSGSVAGTGVAFNNTIEKAGASGNLLSCAPSTNPSPVTLANNHWIFDATTYSPNCTSQFTASPKTDLIQTHTQANANSSPHFDQYTNSETFANSPVVATNSTVGVGTNQTSGFCAALSTAASSDSALSDAASACGSDTRYSCTYNTSNHTVTCPARTTVTRPTVAPWDIGAYQFAPGAPSSAPAPMFAGTVNLQGTVTVP